MLEVPLETSNGHALGGVADKCSDQMSNKCPKMCSQAVLGIVFSTFGQGSLFLSMENKLLAAGFLGKSARICQGHLKIGARPNTVSESTVSNTELSESFGLTELRRENSVSSSQPIICVPKRTHQVLFWRTHRVCRRTQRVLSSDTVLEKLFRNMQGGPLALGC